MKNLGVDNRLMRFHTHNIFLIHELAFGYVC